MRAQSSVLTLATVALPLVALATTVVPLSRAELAARADTIVRAKVGPRTTVRSEKSGRILTRSSLTVLTTYKGEHRAQRELEQMGGTLGGATLVVPGDATLAEGEEVVVYMTCAGKQRCHLLGLAMGKFGVRTGPDGRRIAVRELKGLNTQGGNALDSEPALLLEELERELVKGAKQ